MNEGLENKEQKKEMKSVITTLSTLLANMCCNADEDTPSEYRTRHFRDAMNEAYEYLEEIGYLEKEEK